jgi:hypothetical protein
MRKLLTIFFLLSFTAFSQNDSITKRYKKINWLNQNLNTPKTTLYKKLIIPLVFGSTALVINNQPLKQNLQDQIRAPFNGYKTHLDDYIQYAPTAIMYTADLFKIKAEHSVWNQTKLLFISEVITSGIVFGLKYGVGIQRPDSSSFTSFPSGHTAQAFVQAQALHNEFKNTSPLLAYSGYLFATSTGLLRVTNNKHWLPDVIIGAGIAILVTNIVYHYEPLKEWNPFFKFKNTSDISFQFHPTFSNEFVGVNLKLNL